MPTDVTKHPSDVDLIAYAGGRLRVRHRVPIEAHLAECDQCIGRLDSMLARAKPDPLLKRIRSVGGPKTVSDPTPFTGRVLALTDVQRTGPAEFTYELFPGGRRVPAGVVHQAREHPGDKVVSVTFLAPDPARTPDGRERVVGIVRDLDTVVHPNVLMPRSIRPFGDAWGIVSDDADGIDFHALACAQNRPGVGLVCDYFRQAAAGLAAAHARGVVHGDLKLADLVLIDRATVRVTGFLTPHLRPGPPPADAALDVLALGRGFASMLSGRTYGTSQSVPLTPARDLEKSLPASVYQVLMRLTAEDPARRYPTMADAADALAKLVPTPVGQRRAFWRRLFALGS